MFSKLQQQRDQFEWAEANRDGIALDRHVAVDVLFEEVDAARVRHGAVERQRARSPATMRLVDAQDHPLPV